MNTSDIQQLMRSVIQRVAVGPDMGKNISQHEAEQVMLGILNNQLDPVQAAVFLIALRMKRESMNEYIGILNALQSEQEPVVANIDELLYIADPFDGYVRHLPMSPFLPAVLAACGLPSMIQGVESVGPKHGITAHKVLALYGANVFASKDDLPACLENVGWGYCDQSMFYPKLFALKQFRDLIVKRTAITTLERVLKPISAKQGTHLLLGYVHKAYPDIYTTMAIQSGFDSALLVKGVEGGVTPALNKPVRSYYLSDQRVSNQTLSDKQVAEIEYGNTLSEASISGVLIKDLPSRAPLIEQTLQTGLDVLSGKQCAARESVLLAASTALFGLKRVASITEALEVAKHSLDNGSAKAYFEKIQQK